MKEITALEVKERLENGERLNLIDVREEVSSGIIALIGDSSIS